MLRLQSPHGRETGRWPAQRLARGQVLSATSSCIVAQYAPSAVCVCFRRFCTIRCVAVGDAFAIHRAQLAASHVSTVGIADTATREFGQTSACKRQLLVDQCTQIRSKRSTSLVPCAAALAPSVRYVPRPFTACSAQLKCNSRLHTATASSQQLRSFNSPSAQPSARRGLVVYASAEDNPQVWGD